MRVIERPNWTMFISSLCESSEKEALPPTPLPVESIIDDGSSMTSNQPAAGRAAKNSKFSSDLSFLTQEDIENQLDVFFKETPHIPESINDNMLFVGDQHDKLLLFREYQNRFDQQVDELMRRNFEDYVIDTCSDIFYEYKYEEIELKEREISRQAELSESSNQECLIS